MRSLWYFKTLYSLLFLLQWNLLCTFMSGHKTLPFISGMLSLRLLHIPEILPLLANLWLSCLLCRSSVIIIPEAETLLFFYSVIYCLSCTISLSPTSKLTSSIFWDDTQTVTGIKVLPACCNYTAVNRRRAFEQICPWAWGPRWPICLCHAAVVQ